MTLFFKSFYLLYTGPLFTLSPCYVSFMLQKRRADSDPEEMGGSGSRINGQIGIRIQNKWADRDPDPEEMGGFGSRRVGRIRIQKRWADPDPEELGGSGSRRDGRIRIQKSWADLDPESPKTCRKGDLG